MCVCKYITLSPFMHWWTPAVSTCGCGEQCCSEHKNKDIFKSQWTLLWVYTQEEELLGHMIVLVLMIWVFILFPYRLHTLIYTPNIIVLNTPHLHCLVGIWSSWPFNDRYLSRCELVSQGGPDLHSPSDQLMMLSIFSDSENNVQSAIFTFSLWKCLLWYFVIFKT